MRKYYVEYEIYRSPYDPYVTPGSGVIIVTARNKKDAKNQVERPGCMVTSVTRADE